jgi:hypothetical protein
MVGSSGPFSNFPAIRKPGKSPPDGLICWVMAMHYVDQTCPDATFTENRGFIGRFWRQAGMIMKHESRVLFRLPTAVSTCAAGSASTRPTLVEFWLR